MKRKNGFTLIELLAVIVILAIIALIATPIVLNIINDSKESSVLRSAEFYLDAVEHSIATAILKNKNITDDTYNIKDGDICLNENCTDKLEVEVNGDAPKEGTITIENGNITGLNITISEKEITKNSKGELVYVKFLDEVCELKSGTAKTEGAKYECKVDPNKDAYTFYVLNIRNAKGEIITETSTDKTAVSINLIMDRNINTDGTPTTKAILESEKNTNGGIYNLVAWVSKSDAGTFVDFDGDGCEYESGCVLNDKGPLTAMNFLQEATKNWTNTNEITVDTFTDDTGEIYNMKTYNTYSRMPYYNEVKDVSTDKMWLIDYLTGEHDEYAGIEGRENAITGIYGYWTLTASSYSSYRVWHVDYNGSMMEDFSPAWDDCSGVRPVINLKI